MVDLVIISGFFMVNKVAEITNFRFWYVMHRHSSPIYDMSSPDGHTLTLHCTDPTTLHLLVLTM